MRETRTIAAKDTRLTVVLRRSEARHSSDSYHFVVSTPSMLERKTVVYTRSPRAGCGVWNTVGINVGGSLVTSVISRRQIVRLIRLDETGTYTPRFLTINRSIRHAKYWNMGGEHYWQFAHSVLGVYHIIIGVVVFSLYSTSIENTEVDVFVRIPNITISGEGDDKVYTVEADRKHVVGSVSPIFLHALVSCLTAVSHWTSALVYNRYGLKRFRPNPIRWVEYSITATLMTVSGFIGIGNGDLFFLLSICFLGVLLQYCGYKVEETAVRGQWRPYFVLGSIVQIAIALPLVHGTAAASREQGGFGLVILLICYVLYYASFAINAWYDAAKIAPVSLTNRDVADLEKEKQRLRGQQNMSRGFTPPDDRQKTYLVKLEEKVKDEGFMITDERYAILSFTSKTALFWITVGGLMYETVKDDDQDDWLAVLWVSAILPAFFVFFFLGHQTHLFPEWVRDPVRTFTGAKIYKSATEDYYNTSSEKKTTMELNRRRDATFQIIAGTPGGNTQTPLGVPTLKF